MQLIRSYHDCPAEVQGAAVAIGNFDGLHRGHRSVIRLAQEKAAALRVPSAVMTFHPHPRVFFSPTHAPIAMMPLSQKIRLLRQWGIDVVYLMRFQAAFAALTAGEFEQQVLFKGIGAAHLVVGEDFIYGHQRHGNSERLQREAAAHGVGVTRAPLIKAHGQRCSSSLIRMLLSEGQVEEAAAMLGRPYVVEGRVCHGDKRGGAIGFPTANLSLHGLFTPARGVYVVAVEIEDDTTHYQGVANIGCRPTFGKDHQLWLEVHVFDLSRDLYGTRLSVTLHHFIRPEQAFDGIKALTAQIHQDCELARQWWLAEAAD